MTTEIKSKKVWFELGKPLRSYIRQFLDQEADVDDIYQDTQIRMMEISNSAHVINPNGYARKIAKNLIIDRSRQAYVNDEEFVVEPECEKSELDNIMERRQRIEVYQNILTTMPRVRREVFVNYRIKGQSKQQICQQMGLSMDAVNKHITRALSSLKEQIQQVMNENQ